jgi:hypothetical protein
MGRFSIPAGRLVGFVALAAAGLIVVGCNPGSSGSSSPTSPSAGKSSAPSTGKSSSSSPASHSSGGFDTSLFPVTVGNTWVYQSTVGSTESGTSTNVITAVTPDSGGERVTFSTRPDIAGLPTKPTNLVYQLYSNGSIGVPFSQFNNSTVTVMGGGILWPSAAQLASGQPHTSTLTLRISVSGHATTIVGHVTVKGEGTQSVTVPAGTYQATVVNESIAESFDGINLSTDVKTWLANGVGPVKSVATSITAGKSSILSSDELKSFKQG